MENMEHWITLCVCFIAMVSRNILHCSALRDGDVINCKAADPVQLFSCKKNRGEIAMKTVLAFCEILHSLKWLR